MKKRFKKIHWNEKEVRLEWTSEDGTSVHEHELTSAEAPHLDFDAALQALRGDVLVIVELDDTDYGEGLRVQAVSLSLSAKTGHRGAVITALKTLAIANGPLALHTPHLVEAAAEEGSTGKAESEDTRGVMPTDMLARIETLEREAWAYLDGKRAPKAQQELELSSAPAKITDEQVVDIHRARERGTAGI